LPTPIARRSGWPWETGGTTATPPPAAGAPRITVVTPSYNQGAYVERTLRSVLLQHYPNLEYIVIDGGSTDESSSVIKHYESHLASWVSEPDGGQADAINKGLRMATGEIVCWLNSDDFYFPGTLDLVASILGRDTGHVALVGDCLRVHQDGTPPILLEASFESRERLVAFWKGYRMHQPSIFWRREVTEQIGLLNDRLDYAFDFDYWARIAEHHDFCEVDATLAGTLYHSAAKTGDGYRRYHAELREHARSYWGSPLRPAYWQLSASMFNAFAIQQTRDRLQVGTRLRSLLERRHAS
jgi:glycosyltransferase involved in cell wall biosynthesis